MKRYILEARDKKSGELMYWSQTIDGEPPTVKRGWTCRIQDATIFNHRHTAETIQGMERDHPTTILEVGLAITKPKTLRKLTEAVESMWEHRYDIDAVEQDTIPGPVTVDLGLLSMVRDILRESA